MGNRAAEKDVEQLFTAVRNGKVRVITSLLDEGHDVNARNDQYQTLLMQAVYIRKDDVRTHVIRLLLGKGADVNAQDEDGTTALMMAAFEPQREDVVRRLVASGSCDPNLQDRKGDTAIMHAVYSGNHSVIRILANSSHTKLTLDVDRKNRDGLNPLLLAFKLRHVECCRVLVEEGCADMRVVRDRDALMRLLSGVTENSTQRSSFSYASDSNATTLPKLSNNSCMTNGYSAVESETDDQSAPPSTRRSKKKKRKREKMESSATDTEQNGGLKPLALSPTAKNALNRRDVTPRGEENKGGLGYDRGKQLSPLSSPKKVKSPLKQSASFQSFQDLAKEYSKNGVNGGMKKGQSVGELSSLAAAQNFKGRLSPINVPTSTSADDSMDPFGTSRRDSVLPAIQSNGNRINLVGTSDASRNP